MQVIEIQSFSNAKFKQLKALQKTRNRKKEGVFIMEGRPELDLAFKSGLKPITIAYSESYIALEKIDEMIAGGNVAVLKLSKELFDDLTYQNVPGNFMAVFPVFEQEIQNLEKGAFTIVLDGVQKPGNLGAVLRTCDALGIKNVICTNAEIDLFNPNVLRNSRGAAFSVHVILCSAVQAQTFLIENGYRVFAAALTSQAVDFNQVKPTGNEPVSLVFGSESDGLDDQWLTFTPHHIVIPMRGVVDSLNLSVSVAIIASHYYSES